MTVSVDQDKCTLCRLCLDLCPAVFHYDALNCLVEVAVNTVPPEWAKGVIASAGNCPAQAISLG